MNEYDAWLADHISAFGLPAEAAATFLQWQPAFSIYTTEELRSATKALILNRKLDSDGKPVLRWAENHRIAIQEAIDRIRLERSCPAIGAPATVTNCPLCSQSGFVEVPHPLLTTDGKQLNPRLELRVYNVNYEGKPVFKMMHVVCNCSTGFRIAQTQRAAYLGGTLRSVQMTLDRYQQAYPNWREILAEIEATRTAPADAKPKRRKAGSK